MAAHRHDLQLQWLPGRYAVCRLEPVADVPAWACNPTGAGDALRSITRTDRELSIVAPQADVPTDTPHEPGWVALRVVGRLDFNLVGVLATLLQPLADAGVSVFTISTYDTDIILFKEDQKSIALHALRAVCTVPE